MCCFFSGKPSPVIRVISCTNTENPLKIRKGDKVELRCSNKGFLAIKHCKWYIKDSASSAQLRLKDKTEEGEIKETRLCLCCKKGYDIQHDSNDYEHEFTTEYGFKVIIMSVDLEHEGEYTCKAKNIFRENTSDTVSLKLQGNVLTFLKTGFPNYYQHSFKVCLSNPSFVYSLHTPSLILFKRKLLLFEMSP